MSHGDVLFKRLDRNEAKKLLAKFLSHYEQGKAFLHLTNHFKERCLERGFSLNDAVNVMKAESILKQVEPDIKTGQMVYNVETPRMGVTFQFIDETRIRLITVKKK